MYPFKKKKKDFFIFFCIELGVQENIVYDSVHLLRSDVSDRKAQIQQVAVSTTQCIPFSQIDHGNNGSLRMKGGGFVFVLTWLVHSVCMCL